MNARGDRQTLWRHDSAGRRLFAGSVSTGGDTAVRLARAADLDMRDDYQTAGVDGVDADMVRRRVAAFMDRLVEFNDAAAELNRRRLAIAVDALLPAGVVRCVECGRFVSELELAHDCPTPRLIAAGCEPARARELAHAGFISPVDVAVWSTMIDQVGVTEAGLWRATGLSPLDARRMRAAGEDPRTWYLDVAAVDPAELLEARRADLADRLNSYLSGLGGHGSYEDTVRWVGELTDVGRMIDEQIAERVARRREDLRAEKADELVAAGLGDTVDDVLGDGDLSGSKWLFAKSRGLRDGWTERCRREADDAMALVSVLRGYQPADRLSEADTELLDELRPMFTRGEAMWVAAHAVSQLETRDTQAVTQETVAVLSGLRPFGGVFNADCTPKVKPLVNATAQLLPSSWVARSNSYGPLKVESTRGAHARAGYSHNARGKSTTRTTRDEWEEVTDSIGLRGVVTDDQLERYVRACHPEAFDPAEFDRKGRVRGRKALWSGRTRNIRDIKFDPETGRVTFRCEKERVRQITSRGEPTAKITANDVRSSVHEFGHRAENTIFGLQRLMAVWRSERCTDMSTSRIAGCGRDEFGYEDSFVSHYIGKTYVSGDTEVLSVGLEAVLTGSHGGLLGSGGGRADTDHRALILGVLATIGVDE